MNFDALTKHVPAPYLYFAAGAATVAFYHAVKTSLDSNKTFGSPSPIRPSPLLAAQHDPASARLAYPPSGLLPGARDVPSSYGTIRVYEFGPATSTRRILFLHGISTPCVSLAAIAERLAAAGARVMLLDLFGRGWSDGPADLPYDGRLAATQVLLALASSSVGWTAGGARFALAGYSLGGGLAADFAAWHPEMVSELVLIAPGGLLREVNISWRSWLIYYARGFFPQSWSETAVERSLISSPKPVAPLPATANPAVEQDPKTAIGADGSVANEQVAPSAEVPQNAVMKTSGGDVDMGAAVDYQIQNHSGFLHAFVASIRSCPIQRQHGRWAKIGQRARARKEMLASLKGELPSTEEEARVLRQGLESGQALLFLGGQDKLVPPREVGPDAIDAMGADEIKVVEFAEAGHELPITYWKEVADAILEHWSLGGTGPRDAVVY